MYFKLARKSVIKSYKDYAIYFITLSVAVCIFYSFNTIEAQQAVMDMSQSGKDFLKRIAGIISIISVGVSFIFGGLIIYANNFMIKKRKRELGIYMTLGMKRNKVARILVIETFLIGCLSLGIGLAAGILISQGSSKLIAGLFNLDLTVYRFVISYDAIEKTALYFGVIFILIILFNQLVVARVKLIDLLQAAKKNENLKVKGASVSITVFLIAAASLAYAYIQVLQVGFDPYHPRFLLGILLGALGTLLFFFGLAGFLMHILQKNRSFYLKRLNLFVLRQVHNKINTNFVSMTVITLMLFVTLLSFFVVLNYKNNLDKTAQGLAPFAASMSTGWNENNVVPDIKAALEQLNFQFAENENYVFFDIYATGATQGDVFGGYVDDAKLPNREISLVKLSDYNRIRALKGRVPFVLKERELLIVSNNGAVSEGFNRFMRQERSMKLRETTFVIVNREAVAENLMNTPNNTTFLYLIVPDSFVEELPLQGRALNIEPQGGDPKQFSAKYTTLFEQYFPEFDAIRGFTSEQSQLIIFGVSIFLTFLGVYIGLVFLLSSAVVLALQQLVEANESVERYRVLKKIGASERMINQTIFRQTFIYFFLPFVVAVMHGVVGVKVMNDYLKVHDASAISSSAFMLALVFITVYGGYFYTTYTGYKRIINAVFTERR